MLFTDSHAHFDSYAEDELEDILDRACRAGVSRMMAIGGSPAANLFALRLAESRKENVRAAVGYDRDQADNAPDTALVEKAAAHSEVLAIGEIGLDYHYCPDTAENQKDLFREMLKVACKRELPVIVHSREADADTLDLLKFHVREWRGPRHGIGVLHCFTGTADFAVRLLELGLHISFSGIITFKNATELRWIATEIPDDRLLIETDSPYLAPVPHRGRKNEPAYTIHVAEQLAEIRGCSVERIADITTRNAASLFRWE